MMIITRMLALVGLGLLLGAADSWIRPVQLRLIPQGPAPAPAPAISPPSDGANPAPPDPAQASAPKSDGAGTDAPAAGVLGLEITVAQAKSLFDQGVMFIDARHDEEFLAERVAGAINLTSSMFDGDRPPEALAVLNPDLPLVIYCSGGDCDASHAVGIRLQQAGFSQIHIMTDGLPGWKKQGLSVQSGPPGPQ